MKMFSEETREVFKSLSGINNSYVVSYPKTAFSDENNQMLCSVDLSEFEDEFDEFGIYDMSNLLNAIDLVNDPDITLEDGVINIVSDDSKERLEYITSDVDSLSKGNYKVIESTKKVNTIYDFELTKEMLTKITKAVSVFPDFDIVSVRTDNDKVVLSLKSYNKFNTNSNSFEIILEGDSDQDFEINIPVSSFTKLPKVDYTFEVKYNEEKDAYRVILTNPLFEIVLSTQK
jgi:archaellin